MAKFVVPVAAGIAVLVGIVTAAVYSEVYLKNLWSDTMDMVAVKQTDFVIKKYAFSFAFPELIHSLSPLGAALFTVIFNSLYMIFIGVCIFVINLMSSSRFGWIMAAIVHMIGYIAYANGGFLIPLRYSLLCLSVPAYHYIIGLKMSSGYSLGVFLILIISMVCIGRNCISKSLLFDWDSK